jgi:hypothetical protein
LKIVYNNHHLQYFFSPTKFGPEGFSLLIEKIVCQYPMHEEPLQSGILPLLIGIIVTIEGVFLNSTRRSYKNSSTPLSELMMTSVDM